MPTTDLVKEAERLMLICNACRYCEGYCAVFPAMMQRKTFPAQDLVYFANLCHNCRGCYYACQYAPPHEFGVNIPKTFSELRVESYQDYAWPGFLAGLFQRNGLVVSLITAACLVIVMLLTNIFQDSAVMSSAHTGEGAFYEVIPHWVMVLPASAVFLFAIFALWKGLARFWRDTGGSPGGLGEPKALWRATLDAGKMRYLAGGGDGCNYPDERFSHARRWLHQMVLYGFLLCFAATCVATVYDYGFGWQAPYPYWSLPVVLGTVGGVGLLIGTAGLLWLKRQSDPEPGKHELVGMDIAFLVLLFLTSLTGLVLLVFRETAAMGQLLAIHLGVVLALFVTLPYSKFVHGIYRFAALVRYAIEKSHPAPKVTKEIEVQKIQRT